MRVTDGDTIVVLDSANAQHKIRLQGIDAPERKQAFGTKSKEHLSDSVAGKFVVVDYSKRDRYQRILGKVLLSGEDINLEQIKAGPARQLTSNRNRNAGHPLRQRRFEAHPLTLVTFQASKKNTSRQGRCKTCSGKFREFLLLKSVPLVKILSCW